MLTVGDGGDGGFSHSRRCRVKCSLCLPLVMVVTVVSPTPDVALLMLDPLHRRCGTEECTGDVE